MGGGRPGGGGFGGGFGNWGGGGFLIGQQPGISKTNSFGLNYSDKWGKKLEVTGSYFFNDRNTVNEEALKREYFLSGDSSQYYYQVTKSDNNNNNHRASFRFDYKIDSFNSILITPTVNIQNYNNESLVTGLNYITESDYLSQTLNRNQSDRTAINFNNNILYRHSFRKKGRTFSLSFNTGINNQDGNYYTDSYVQYKGSSNLNDTIRQYNDQFTKGHQINPSVNYTEPIGKKGAILEFRYNPSFTYNNSDRKTYMFENASGKYSVFDSSLSNVFDNTYNIQRGGINFQKGERNKQISFGIDVQSATLESDQVFPYTAFVKRNFTNVLPNARINLPLSKKENIRIFYRAFTFPPSVTQLQDVYNNTNPILVSTGNPDLKQQYGHRLGGRYQYSNTSKGTSFFVNFFGSLTDNYVATATYIATKDSVLTPSVTLYQGSQLTKPINLDGQRSLNMFLTYARPLKFMKTNLNLNGGIMLNRTPGMINYEEGFTNSYNFNTGIVLASNISQYVDFTVSYNANFNNAKSTLQSSTDNKYFMHTAGIRLNLLSKKGWLLNTDVTNQLYNGLSAAFNQSYWLWNMAVGKKILKGQKGEIRLSVFDLLDQNQSISRTISETYLEDVQTRVLQQYFMLTFTYNLRNFGKAPARPNWNQNMMPGGDFRRN
jgi:hypothetical protein